MDQKLYTIEKVQTFEKFAEDLPFFVDAAYDISAQYGWKFSFAKFDIHNYIAKNRLMVCRRKSKPVGFMMSRLFNSIFNREIMILYQDLLYACPETLAAHYLMEDFIDFGKRKANHIITCIGKNTNIKDSSLINKGFIKLEELFRMEIK